MNPVEEYIERKPPEERPLWHHLRFLILESGEGITEGIKYGLPFFMHHKKIWIYLNPIKGGVDVSFMDGVQFEGVQHLLRVDGRKRVGSYRVHSVESIVHEELELLIEAAHEFKRNKS
ncbi:DUF1801 domain-containing protein [Phaeocystidibacter luteus]|uniref:DUF1801 domain-containing protein n=1 Tax=Phaeocystidibacter luteus TaxID=911197 RepID=A0A6N6RL44_9FLAO|nr:DUF1801 domain-containing protein [Phaeocystidibacter luteus]KAB2810372.1 DUF1801 domain-containing protein [Phaeocystidibacter luteus]